jgi:5-methyltetrahydropteroyltriglutamate--homocysteine methyltransferase
MPSPLPLLPTSVIGSYAIPSWVHLARQAAQQDHIGADDLREVEDDAVDMAIRDQEAAGVDIITDGEMRRVGFFTAEFYSHITGLEEQAQKRRTGSAGHDQRESYLAVEPLAAPAGLGLLEEYHYLRARTTKQVKMPIPGPFTLAGRIQGGALYQDRMEVAYALADLVNAELKALDAAGVDFIQIDEPSYAVHSKTPEEFVKLFNHAVRDVQAKISVHLCFGNFVGRPVAKRTYRPLFPYILEMKAHQLALEFANREMSEIELWRDFPSTMELAAGVVDVKNYYCETPQDVAERIRTALQFIPAEQLSIVPDCGFSQTARWAARKKLQAMVEGAKIVRYELAGG